MRYAYWWYTGRAVIALSMGRGMEGWREGGITMSLGLARGHGYGWYGWHGVVPCGVRGGAGGARGGIWGGSKGSVAPGFATDRADRGVSGLRRQAY